MKKRFSIIWLLCLVLSPLMAQHDHDHPHNEPGMENAHLMTGVFSVYAETQKFELTLKHGHIEPGEESEMTLYVADYITNEPVSDVELTVQVKDQPDIVIEVELHETGVYHLHGKFPEAIQYALLVNLNAKEKGAELMQLGPVEIGKEPPQPDAAPVAEEEHSHNNWWQIALALIGGLGLGYLLFRRSPRTAMSVLIVLLVHTTLQKASAHEGHDHAEEESKTGNKVLVPKETQFLFDIRTLRIATGDFTPAVALYGTIIPAPGEYAEIISPYGGRISAINVTPGQKVKAGQTLLTIQPAMNPADRVGVVAETGRLKTELEVARAEVAAAEKEVNRLKAIEDIAAKKDIQAAAARYNAAKAHLESLQSVTSNAVISSGGAVVLKAPVSGTVGQFSLARGAEIREGASLFSVTSLDEVYIEAQVYNRDAAEVRNASRFTVIGSDDTVMSDKVSYVSAALEINQSNQSQKVIFRLTNPGGDFKIGEFVTLQAYLKQGDKSIFVPNSALSEINGKPVVFIKDNPESYSIRYISLGEDNGTHTVVQKGLDEKERYVTEGTYQVKMMMLNQ
jgi:cobalt-zinc-cadmium efflux system membrane fusion protein